MVVLKCVLLNDKSSLEMVKSVYMAQFLATTIPNIYKLNNLDHELKSLWMILKWPSL